MKLHKTPARRIAHTVSPLADSTIHWFEEQFPASTFNGRFQIAYRKEGNRAIWPLFTGVREDVISFLSTMYVSRHIDYYVTANSMSGVQRSVSDLFGLHNIVIDLDSHSADHGLIHQDIEDILWRLDRDLFSSNFPPPPSSIVVTGRGIQLWWSIKAISSKCLPWYQIICDTFIRAISDCLADYPEFSHIEVDGAASKNPVGYYRLPGTTNTHTGSSTYILRQSHYIYDTHELLPLANKWKTENPLPAAVPQKDPFIGQYSDAEIYIMRDFRVSAFFRLRQLIQLRLLRNRSVGEETRNNFCLLVYSTIRPVLGHDAAWEKLIQFNNGFKAPMSETDLRRTIVSAQRKGGYKYRNETIIRFLSITPEEQDLIGLYSPAQGYREKVRLSAHPGRDAAAKIQKEHRNARIRSLHDEGASIKAIANKLQLNRRTVSTVLKDSTIETIQEKVIRLFKNGNTTTQIALIVKRSIRTIQRYISQHQLQACHT